MDDYGFEEFDEYGADPSDWDDLGTLSDTEAIEEGWADAAADDHLEADYEDLNGYPED